MTPEDRELLQALRREQLDLEQSLSRIGERLRDLEATSRNGFGAERLAQLELPAVPSEPVAPPRVGELVPSLTPAHPASLPPLPPAPSPEPAAAGPTLPPVPRASLEFHLGRLLTRLGVVFGVITLALVLSLTHHYLFALLGRAGLLGICGIACVGVIMLGRRLEERKLRFFGRSLFALGLAGLFVTFYAAHAFEPVRVIASPVLGGLLLLFWSGYVFLLAEKRNAQGLALFSVLLAYFSTAINPVGRFSLAADLLLAGVAALFLVRRGWATTSYLALLGTYLAVLRRMVVDPNGAVVLDTSRSLPWAPYAAYLIGAWVIFTVAIMLAARPSFRGEKRFVFLTLNNGAFAALLTLTTYLAGYGYTAAGWTLFWTGVLYLLAALSSSGRRPDASFAEVTRAYFAQGLGAFTLGVVGVFGGMTRGLMLGLETFILGVAMLFSRGDVVRVATAVVAALAAWFLGWEIAVETRDPWLLGGTGAAIMLTNAWWARLSSIRPPRDFRPSSLYYCALGLGLIAFTMASEVPDLRLAPSLAVVAVTFTFLVYLIPLFELPPLAQFFVLAAQVLVLFPRETGETIPWTSTAEVAFCTLLLLVWWSRQRVIRPGTWLVLLNVAYGLALSYLIYQAVRPYVNEQTWMVVASLLSGYFLFFGALTRVWSLAVIGQLFLVAAVRHFFYPHGTWTPFPWSAWAGAIPLAIVLADAHALNTWLDEYHEMPRWGRRVLRLTAYALQLLALAMLSRAIFGKVAPSIQIVLFLVLGTFLLTWNTARASAFGIRCSFLLSAVGIFLILRDASVSAATVATFLNGLGLVLLLSQPAMLRHSPRRLVTRVETWLLVLLSAGAGWLFVSAWVAARLPAHDLTMAWALYALFLFGFGIVLWERRQRWCALVILAAAIARVFAVDIWGLSTGYKVVTFLVMTLVALGLGYIYARFASRLRSWL